MPIYYSNNYALFSFDTVSGGGSFRPDGYFDVIVRRIAYIIYQTDKSVTDRRRE